MLIANPIYDTIFKFLMDDNESAKIILSTLLNVDIEELTATTTIQSYLGEDEKNWVLVNFHTLIMLHRF